MSWLDARERRLGCPGGELCDLQPRRRPDLLAAGLRQHAADGPRRDHGQTDHPRPDPRQPVGGQPDTEATFGFGSNQGLAVYDGTIDPAWSSNLNGGTDGKALLDVLTPHRRRSPPGPRVIRSSMGPDRTITVNDTGPVTINGPAGRRHAAGRGLHRHSSTARSIPPPSPPTEVQVIYRDTTTEQRTGGPVPVLAGLAGPDVTTPITQQRYG